ncbi:MAG: hypothetical protein US50_C0023G0006 [Candidatus Nomurabacteria bacterium GW2011_GWB1_37_5]|uniref:Uncharacterized protein n=1 Tax=Candidatus Nomurabacteria bacterium GW2011_GWB1_37_5 TaxID=1618742 RepID=A0A0G0JEI5_9BACT|nr:MAG: hypothetical protein US50_C0023G0006 [Candidatus Nomurabacteria bacterium GW2011_GWB1_37_5]
MKKKMSTANQGKNIILNPESLILNKRWWPSKEEFAEFERKILELGYQKITNQEKHFDFDRLGLFAPEGRKNEGPEVGYKFNQNHMTVKIWTSYVRKVNQVNQASQVNQVVELKKKDSVWIVYLIGDEAVQFQRLYRTKTFLTRLLSFARAARNRVANRPLCPENKSMMIVVKRKLKKDLVNGQVVTKYWRAKYWRCLCKSHKTPPQSSPYKGEEVPKKFYTEHWETHGLDEIDLNFLKPRKKWRKKYYDKRRKTLINKLTGKPEKFQIAGTSITRRKSWKKNRPGNAIPAGQLALTL